MADEKIIDFMGWRKPVGGFSIILMVVAVLAIALRGFNLGLDFSGGSLIELHFSQPADPQQVRDTLHGAGLDAVVQHFGSQNELLVRLHREFKAGLGEEVVQLLDPQRSGSVTLTRAEFVGSQVGDELLQKGLLAVFVALIAVLLYVAWRFPWKFAVGAVLALFHDVVVTLGAFALFQWEFDLTVLAAVLAIIGYSLNDSIVVGDRIRECFRKIRKESSYRVINISITQTLDRTIFTSLTVILAVLALFFLGGDAIHGFSKALLIGVGFGTYSSVYVASSLLLLLRISREDFLVQVKEAAKDDGRP